eukprot:TRINITY_DN3453_c0_g1_i4.p1 TRINITY_DN3453_c0_g1~~TRINITY_DN3453_c0_g1_i4.p1  ORF type:complete len:137 (-),score=26.02 TRINITY_DN3453_c0_g1_i4:24-434(-)
MSLAFSLCVDAVASAPETVAVAEVPQPPTEPFQQQALDYQYMMYMSMLAAEVAPPPPPPPAAVKPSAGKFKFGAKSANPPSQQPQSGEKRPAESPLEGEPKRAKVAAEDEYLAHVRKYQERDCRDDAKIRGSALLK